MLLLAPSQAAAHAFLINSNPSQGARLAHAPTRLTMDFSEPLASERVSVRTEAGGIVSLPHPVVHGSVVVQPLSQSMRGIYIVSWHVVSASDGHLTDGELAFAVGTAGAPPKVSTSGTQIGWSQAIVTWLLFAGLALALGGIASERWVWRIPEASSDRMSRAPVRIGVAIATAASLLLILLLAHEISGGGIFATFGGLGRALRSRSGALALAAFAALVVAEWLGRLRRSLAALPLLVAIVATAWRGHSGSSGYAWAVAANAIHLVAAALWVGALAHLVLVIARGRGAVTARELADPARRYARLALGTVVVMVVAGVVTALAEFGSVGQLASTGYGRVLLIKGGLVAVALAAALGARTLALRSNPGVRVSLLRRLTRTELGVLVAVVLAAGVLANTAPPHPAAAASSAVLGPAPLTGPRLQLAGLAGQITVGVTVSAHELRFAVLPPTQTPGPGIRLTANAVGPETGRAGVDLHPRPCGRTCFTLRYHIARGRTLLTVAASDPPWKGGTTRIAIPWPPGPDRRRLLAHVVQTLRAIPKLSLTEIVTSGPGSHVEPDHYVASGKALLSQGEAFGSGAVDVHAISHHAGLTELAFVLPSSDIWYRMTINRRDRIVRETIIDAPAHLIRRTFRYPPVRR